MLGLTSGVGWPRTGGEYKSALISIFSVGKYTINMFAL